MANLTKVQEIKNKISPTQMASELANQFQTYKTLRQTWEGEKKEIREYVFATDTTKTTNSQLPWKNTTVRPKLCQIRDNLHANYMSALFPHEKWLTWEGKDQESTTQAKRMAIESYMHTKLSESGFQTTISQLIMDYIDYGNCFADVVYVDESIKDPKTGKQVSGYKGPKLVRISPFDIVFDVTAADFEGAPKFSREFVSLGELRKRQTKYPALAYQGEIVDRVFDVRRELSDYKSSDLNKAAGFQVDGFGNLSDYYQSGYVELITFEGDFYDQEHDKLYENHIVVVVDRSYILASRPIDSWNGKSTKRHCGWRLRPDNLMSMGPLDNLVGMQYRIDHLENLKADMMDLMAHPPLKVKGYVEDFEWEPFSRIHMDVDADVETMKIDSAAFSAEVDIEKLEYEMEQMAGAPREAAGIRTPGEKTAFEVNTLTNAASRIFQNKISYFEQNFMELLLNAFLMVARENLNGSDLIATVDKETSAITFSQVTREDLTAYGTVRAKGARHYATRNALIQEVTTLLNSAAGSDPDVRVHISGIRIAEMLERVLGVEEYKLVQENIRVYEQFERQQLIASAQKELQANGQDIPPDQQGAPQQGQGQPQQQAPMTQ